MKGKKILITGGTGSLGQALARQLKELDCKVIIYSRDEGKQALTFGEDSAISCVIGDVRDFDKLNATLYRHKPDYIIHAAALKRIDDMEFYPDECVKTNITGSENVARAALENNIEKCILISTDKACQPVNVYGASKFTAERIFTNYDYNSKSTIFSSVRYGNVIASRGSFIPAWINLIERGLPIKVTSMDCTRFLFTLNSAVETVLESLLNSFGGEVFIPEINSFKMRTIIKSIKKICNLDPGDELVNYEIVGMRPGEKLHEDMLSDTELPYTYKVPKKQLLQVRPQYTNKKYKELEKYKGPVLNSLLHVSEDVEELKTLIHEGLKC